MVLRRRRAVRRLQVYIAAKVYDMLGMNSEALFMVLIRLLC